MCAKKVFFAALIGLCCSFTIRAQGPTPQGTVPPPTVTEGAAVPSPGVSTTPTVQEGSTGLSSWITYERHDGSNGPTNGPPGVVTEIFFRVGPSVPVGHEFFGQVLPTGWMVEGGARALFFNRAWTAAWVGEVAVSNVNNQTEDTTTVFMHNLAKTVSIRALNQTYFGLGLGREWYLGTPADTPGRHWRFGLDVGGRYGAATTQFNEIRHRTNVIEGAYGAVHTDLEIPYGRYSYLAGVRIEYDIMRSNILDGRSNLQAMTGLFNFGVKY